MVRFMPVGPRPSTVRGCIGDTLHALVSAQLLLVLSTALLRVAAG